MIYIYNCIILKSTEIEDELTIKNSIISNNCTIKKGTKMISKCFRKKYNSRKRFNPRKNIL